MKLRVWWIPQIPGKPFHADVASVREGALMLDTLERYDLFQFENNIKPDYANAGGLSMFDPDDKEDGPDGSWVGWFSEEAGTDDIDEYLEWEANNAK
jgi:hypothetical protein